MTGWLNIVGIGAGGINDLSPTALTLIKTADLLVGGNRHLSMAPNDNANRLVWSFPLDGIVEQITEARDQNVVVLATGDPMSFGIGSTLTRHFAAEDITILPEVKYV